MISSPLIHIGYHKTGSTWLQRELFNFNSDIFVPLSLKDVPNAGKFLARNFIRSKEKYLLSPFDLNKATIMEELGAILEEIDLKNRIPVMSDERLSGNPHSGGFDAKAIADRIKACFPDARIFCVIREQKDAILSAYFQYLKAGGIDKLKTYLTRSYDGNRPGFSPYSFRYLELISYYYHLFSPERVLVLPYEMFRDKPGVFLMRLGDFISADLSGFSASVTVIHNKRPLNAITLKFPISNLFLKRSSVNSYSRLYVPMSRSFLDAISRFLQLGDRANIEKMKRQIESIISDRYQSSNKELSGLINTDLSGYGYY